MTSAPIIRRILLVAAMPLPLVACNVGAGNGDAQNTAAAANQGVSRPASAPSRRDVAQVPGGQIAYEAYGDLNSGKTPLLILHGSFMSGDTMRSFIDAFAGDRPVIAMDARGHGRSGAFAGR